MFKIPAVELLDKPRPGRSAPSMSQALANRLTDKLSHFNVDCKVKQIIEGPVVTSFILTLDDDVRYSMITRLSEDVALALEAKSVRISRIPGTSNVTVEIERSKRPLVTLRQVLGTQPKWKDSTQLKIALGMDAYGAPLILDLQSAPHLLIAGTTGSGKSVSLHSIVTSLLYAHTSRSLQLVLIDPKQIELTEYEGIPHLLSPVARNSGDSMRAIRNILNIINDRYKVLNTMGVRGIKEYNNAQERGLNPRLPYITVIIDEFADLMMTSKKSVEDAIVRISQLGRAAGVHLIIATQRPTVNVVTGLIKANIQARLCYRVSSKIDSRVMLDANGAEVLLGKGDGLLRSYDSNSLSRMQGAFVSQQEVERVVAHVKQQTLGI